ncbi:uncharacterized protein LOC125237392 isoform X5 [Leguminivora glycinivorella]|uniref:uncharacterized protein LOC125237392 isoform X5 n=1 Tax=Leguminivora glycinivorella TaxID=1035111 RepID=UPI00200DB0F4|nr:uncharacterized protein LOC125237392 isoform X5 [Leguminivora glycinivorella]
MPYDKCQYHNCDNYSTDDKSMFRFPVNDEHRLKLWIEHSGNKKLKSLTQQELKRRRHLYLCEDHFKDEDISRNTFRSRLISTAVPLTTPKSQLSPQPRHPSPGPEVKPEIKHTYKPRLLPKISKDVPITAKKVTPSGNNEDPIPALVCRPEMPADVPAVFELPVLQEVPIEPFIPEDELTDDGDGMHVINCCKDCAAFTNGFPFWCVQCGRGPLCASCAERAPHDSHFLLRTPRGAPRSHTEAVLSVIRKQLQSENLLALNDSAVKVEIKEEPKEPPSSQPEPSDPEPDPLDPLPNYRYPHTSEQVGKHEVKEHLEKRRLLQVDEHDVKKYLEKRRLLLPNSIRKLQRTALSSTVLKDTTGLKTVLNPKTSGLKLTPKRSQNHFDENETVRDYLAKSTLLKSGNDQPKYLVKLQPKGKSSQTILKDSSDLRTVLNPAPDVLKKTQRVLKATSSKIVLKVIPNDPRETQATNDVKEPIIKSFLKSPGYIKKLKNQPGKQIKSTLLKIPISELTRSGLKTLRNVKPSELLKLESVQKILKMTESRKSEPKEQKLHDLNGVSTPRLGLGAAAALDEKKTEIKIVEL